MDVIFACPNCKQQLEAETSMAGNEIACPSCNQSIVIPEADVANVRINPMAASAAAKEEYHFKVPVHDEPTETLIEKPKPPLDAAAKEADTGKQIRVKCIRRSDCIIEVGKDSFDQVATNFLSGLGESRIISLSPIVYTHKDLATGALMTDYGIMIVYKG